MNWFRSDWACVQIMQKSKQFYVLFPNVCHPKNSECYILAILKDNSETKNTPGLLY